jgi:outer membrane biosynthesis protein TonB
MRTSPCTLVLALVGVAFGLGAGPCDSNNPPVPPTATITNHEAVLTASAQLYTPTPARSLEDMLRTQVAKRHPSATPEPPSRPAPPPRQYPVQPRPPMCQVFPYPDGSPHVVCH